jgi:hypothetical protein
MKSKEIHNILSNKEKKTLRQQYYLNCSVNSELFYEFKEYISTKQYWSVRTNPYFNKKLFSRGRRCQ